MRWKTLISRCSKFIQETVCQISSQLPEFCRRYYRKHFGLFFFRTRCIYTLSTQTTNATTTVKMSMGQHLQTFTCVLITARSATGYTMSLNSSSCTSLQGLYTCREYRQNNFQSYYHISMWPVRLSHILELSIPCFSSLLIYFHYSTLIIRKCASSC